MKTTLSLLAILTLTLGGAIAAPNPIEGELFPPDFLFGQREALGLNETQLQDMQVIVQGVQPDFEKLKGQLEDRAKALQDSLHQTAPDMAQIDKQLRALLSQENEMKIMQVHLLVNLRSKLTPEQVEKARQLRSQLASNSSASASASSNPTDGLAQRLQSKFEKLKGIVQERAAGGQPPEDIVAKAREIQQLVQNGKPQEAEKQLDALLASLTDAPPKP